jgi:hypothetical protein
MAQLRRKSGARAEFSGSMNIGPANRPFTWRVLSGGFLTDFLCYDLLVSDYLTIGLEQEKFKKEVRTALLPDHFATHLRHQKSAQVRVLQWKRS